MVSEVLSLYHKFGKCLLLTPISITKSKKSGLYTCCRAKGALQYVALFYIVFTTLIMLIVDWIGTSVNNDSLLLATVYSLFNMYGGMGLLTLWKCGENIEHVLNSVYQLQRSMEEIGVSVLASVGQLRRTTVFSMAFILVSTVIDLFFYYTSFYRGFYKGFQRYLPESHGLLYGVTNCSFYGPDQIIDGCSVTRIGIILAFAAWISEAVTMLYFFYLNMLCFVHALVLLCFARSLHKYIKETPNTTSCHRMIQKVISEMLSLSGTIEEGIGGIVLCFCLALIPYYSLGTTYVLRFEDRHKAIRHIVNSSAFILILLTAAEANATMKRIGSEVAARALVCCEDEISLIKSGGNYCYRPDKIILLLYRISANDYGLQGKAFTVTYGLVGSVAGLVITYSIIIYQFGGH